MIILGIDTSGREGSIALAQGDASSFEVLEFRPIAGGTYSAQLIPQISEALDKRGIDKHEIDLFAVASGPGSFTGLRVGLSAVKALADVLQKPIATVTVLEAIAINARRYLLREGARLADASNPRIIAALDAQRNEVFAGEYDFSVAASAKLGPQRVSESLLNMGDFLTWLGTRVPVPATFTSDAKIEQAVRASGSPAELVSRPSADSVSRIGLQKYLEGKTVAPEVLDADYIRRSDAEIFSAPGLGIAPK
ncbi:MAG TPA: tRNA (adenosine(37)-N6)-threonylcarbamoyltransferase complex dimerization subunit type 1 TsaB [Clostridia bacterium]|nr:tRNA (adenosine(37)-N6)-threonylcarbamoyltransferase complex dimerization subunit type 1 TsaB [Clostridia bacterium]